MLLYDYRYYYCLMTPPLPLVPGFRAIPSSPLAGPGTPLAGLWAIPCTPAQRTPAELQVRGLLFRAIPSQEIPRELWTLLRGGTVGQGDPLPRDPQESLGARASHGRALGYPMHPGAGRPQRSTSGMTVFRAIPSQEVPRGAVAP